MCTIEGKLLGAELCMYDAQGNICCAEELMPDVAGPADLIGQSWCYKFEIFGISKLPFIAAKCYCQYTFDGQTFTTEVIDQHTEICLVAARRPSVAFAYVATGVDPGQ